MADNVLLSILSRQENDGEKNETEMIAAAQHYIKNGRHYFCYDDDDGDGNIVRNVMRISDGRADVMRKSSKKIYMAFKSGEKSITSYPTPAGDMTMLISTEEVSVRPKAENFGAVIRYGLTLNNVYVGHITLDISAKPTQSFGSAFSGQ